jgi:hypothetical protein
MVSSPAKRGGSLTGDLSKLAVPFGIVLLKESLEKFLKKEKLNKHMSMNRRRVANNGRRGMMGGAEISAGDEKSLVPVQPGSNAPAHAPAPVSVPSELPCACLRSKGDAMHGGKKKPAAGKLAAGKPAAGKPAAGKPAARKPAAKKPVAKKPAKK